MMNRIIKCLYLLPKLKDVTTCVAHLIRRATLTDARLVRFNISNWTSVWPFLSSDFLLDGVCHWGCCSKKNCIVVPYGADIILICNGEPNGSWQRSAGWTDDATDGEHPLIGCWSCRDSKPIQRSPMICFIWTHISSTNSSSLALLVLHDGNFRPLLAFETKSPSICSPDSSDITNGQRDKPVHKETWRLNYSHSSLVAS